MIGKVVAAALVGTGAGVALYRHRRRQAQEEDKLADPSLLSAREKFQRFASLGDHTSMTTEDFVLSLTPTAKNAPSGDNTAAFSSLEKIFRRIDADGDHLLSYPEYCMFVTLISIPNSQFKTAFQMFDENENGKVDLADFKRMMQALVVDPTVKLTFNGGICETFFGKKYDQALSFDRFTSLIDDLRREVRTSEFKWFDKENKGYISFSDFQRLFGLGSSPAGASSDSSASGSAPETPVTEKKVTLGNYHNVVNVLLSTETIKDAMDIWINANPECGGCTKADFVRALRAAKVVLKSTEVDLLFDLLDTDRSGKIDSEEFQAIAKRKASFFASALPRFDQPRRNVIQQWAWCMQQKQ
jgi:Ca2+-binding EF-hand superfamily protein